MSPYGISYQARSEECRQRAAEATWPADKRGWTELAQAWLRLAQSTDVRKPYRSAGVLPAGGKVDELVKNH
jgi:hypothetical protein